MGKIDVRAATAGRALEAYLVSLRLVLPAAMRVFSLRRVLRLIAPHRAIAPLPTRHVDEAVARSERIARRLRAADTCLFRAMARLAAFSSAGHHPTFVLAVRGDDANVGHAWVEVDGVSVGESVDPAYVVTFRFGA